MTSRADLTAAAKFTVRCERCGRTVARNVTEVTASKSAALHEQAHRNADADVARLMPQAGGVS